MMVNKKENITNYIVKKLNLHKSAIIMKGLQLLNKNKPTFFMGGF